MRYLLNVLLRVVSHFDGDGRRRVGFCRQTSDWARDAFSKCDDVPLLKLVKFNRRWSLWKKRENSFEFDEIFKFLLLHFYQLIYNFLILKPHAPTQKYTHKLTSVFTNYIMGLSKSLF